MNLTQRRRDAETQRKSSSTLCAFASSRRCVKGRSRCLQSGFTMIEIAICLAIVGFALVAIIGVLPLGIQVQSDNRQDTIINHDGAYFMDAIRKGAPPDDLAFYVQQISITDTNNVQQLFFATNLIDNHRIIGLLSNP